MVNFLYWSSIVHLRFVGEKIAFIGINFGLVREILRIGTATLLFFRLHNIPLYQLRFLFNFSDYTILEVRRFLLIMKIVCDHLLEVSFLLSVVRRAT